MTKEKALEALKGLPNEFELDELIERLIFIEKVEKGIKEAEEGKTQSHEAVKKMVDSWRK